MEKKSGIVESVYGCLEMELVQKKKTETLKETSQNNDASEMKTESIVFDNAHFM